MPGRKRGGRRRKKNWQRAKRELEFKDEGEEYAQVQKLLGQGRMMVYCFDGKTRLAKIRGKFKRRVWIQLSNILRLFKYIYRFIILNFCK